MSDLREAKEAVDVPVLANTGVKHETVEEVLSIADGAIVGHQPQGRRAHLEPGGPRTGHGHDATGPRGARSARGGLRDRPWPRRSKLFFATDVHGSEMCFRKFLNAGEVYGPDVMVLGGDIAGKAVQAVEDLGGGRFTTTFRGHRYDIETEEELAQVERASPTSATTRGARSRASSTRGSPTARWTNCCST